MTRSSNLAQRSARKAEQRTLGFWQAWHDPLQRMPMSFPPHQDVLQLGKSFLGEILKALVSLKLTILLLAFSMVLVFAATLDQVNLGTWAVREKYFRSFVVYRQVGSLAIPELFLARKATVEHPWLPFTVVPRLFYPNSVLTRREKETSASFITAGSGGDLFAVPQPVTHRPKERNHPSSLIELTASQQSLGVYLVSTRSTAPLEFSNGGRTWRIALRPRRLYLTDSLTLLQFSHDRYPGTQLPKNFSSRLRLNTRDTQGDREVVISMNHPLRYGGLTYYQSGLANHDRTSILQVVRNPSWFLPYVACTLMSIGLLFHFWSLLNRFVAAQSPVPGST